MSDTEQKVPTIEEFASKLKQTSGPEKQLRLGLEYMQVSLDGQKPPYFKGFWEARKLCFPLFKEQMEGPVRSELWSRYTELTREGRELKNLLDQETTFAVEQIDLAISSLEKELKEPSEELAPFELPQKLKALCERKEFYCTRQSELNRLNLFAARVNSLRKELTKTEMRVRHKNKFFQRLSVLGDGIFPRRKELIREISEAFEKDVERFADQHFSEKNFQEEQIRHQVFFYREEIKQLQACAKLLTVNTHAFSTTRLVLASCWDKLRGMEKQLKKEAAHKKSESTDNCKKMQELLAAFKAENFEAKEALRKLDDLAQQMRTITLRKEDVIALKEELKQLRTPFLDQKTQIEQEKNAQFEEAEKVRRAKFEAFKQKIEALKSASLEELKSGLEECRAEASNFSKAQKVESEMQLRLLRDLVTAKQEEALLNLPDDTRASLESLESFLAERKEQRCEIKEQLEEYRKMAGGSALDIEKAMEVGELMESEKERLAKCDQVILDVEQKIEQLKGL